MNNKDNSAGPAIEESDPTFGVPATAARYEAATFTRLGTLSELTLGGGMETDDGMGGDNGDIGSP